MKLMGYEICSAEISKSKPVEKWVSFDELTVIELMTPRKTIKDVYTDVEVVGLSKEEVAKKNKEDVKWVTDRVTDYKKLYKIGYTWGEPTVWIPSWYDVIHIIPESQLDESTRRQRQIDRINHLRASPSPEIAKNIGTIMTALDDLQDFLTTVGVFSRIGGSLLKPMTVVAKGAFSVGDVINQMNLMNKTLHAIESLPRDLDAAIRATKKLPAGKRKAKIWEEMKKHGIDPHMPIAALKSLKKYIENAFVAHPKLSKMQTKVDKRLTRAIPTLGEMFEVGQTTDIIANVGISLGPIVGLAQDLLFGFPDQVPIRFAKQKPSKEEYDALWTLADKMKTLPPTTIQIFQAGAKMLESFAYGVASGQYLPIQDTVAALGSTVNQYLDVRCSEVKDAIKSTIEIIKGWVIGPKKNSNPETLQILKEQGIDYEAETGWPCPNLGDYATIEEIQLAFQKQLENSIPWARYETNRTPDIEWIDYCNYEIAKSGATFASDQNEPINVDMMPSLSILTRSADYFLQPPFDSTDSEFSKWHQDLLKQVEHSYLNGPTYEMCERSWNKVYV